jgi:hypothetical protein
VQVVTSVGETDVSSASRFTFVAPAAPAVNSLSASSGSGEGGTVVTITGTRLGGAQSVLFGDVPAQFFQVSDTQIVAVAPAHPAGAVDVRVVTFGGVSDLTAADTFTFGSVSAPTVTALDVSSGSTAGGTVVVVTGTNLTSATDVFFGSVEADFSVLNSTTLIATAPPQAAGTIDVTVATLGGVSATSSSDHFAYGAAPAPSVNAVTANSGLSTGGALVVILGSNFTAATSVEFGGVAADFQVLSDDTILAYSPEYAAGSGTVDVTVTSDGGTSSTSGADHFTFSSASPAAVSSLSTSSGGSNGGTLVTITGTGFTGATGVSFGGVQSPDWVVNSDTQITALSPGHDAGTFDVIVSGPAGLSAASSSSRFSFSLDGLAAVTSLGTSSGGTAGGTAVVITGTGFSGATGVSFGDVPADFTIDSPTQITAVAPAQDSGAIDVRVFNHSGSSAPGASDVFSYSAASSSIRTYWQEHAAGAWADLGVAATAA